MTSVECDSRIVMTLDAGGTSFRFRALQAGKAITDLIVLPTHGRDLDLCLATLLKGFEQVEAACPRKPVAISFAFPGPADYPQGIIGDLPNLPAFRGGIALGEILKKRFRLPVFINNDGDLFAYGEAIGGMLPHVNNLLEKAGNPKRYKNLFGITIGTGLGGGLVLDGHLHCGDNSSAGSVYLFRNKQFPHLNAEAGACIRAVRRTYAELAGITFDQAPDPRMIDRIARGKAPGKRRAAIETFQLLGAVVGDVLAQALALVDGLAVIGGGISDAWRLFLPAALQELNGTFTQHNGEKIRRVSPQVFNLEDRVERKLFLAHSTKTSRHQPAAGNIISHKLAVGISRLGTSNAIALGAYAFALKQ